MNYFQNQLWNKSFCSRKRKKVFLLKHQLHITLSIRKQTWLKLNVFRYSFCKSATAECVFISDSLGIDSLLASLARRLVKVELIVYHNRSVQQVLTQDDRFMEENSTFLYWGSHAGATSLLQQVCDGSNQGAC